MDLDDVRSGGRGAGGDARPPGNMFRALVFQGVIAMAIVPLPLMLGIKRLGLAHSEGRLTLDEHRNNNRVDGEEEI